MIESLAAELKYSIPSVRRYLVDVGYYSSFTQLAETIKKNREISVKVEQIEQLFEHYSLKKTMLTLC